jgi:hypothetical protein
MIRSTLPDRLIKEDDGLLAMAQQYGYPTRILDLPADQPGDLCHDLRERGADAVTLFRGLHGFAKMLLITRGGSTRATCACPRSPSRRPRGFTSPSSRRSASA